MQGKPKLVAMLLTMAVAVVFLSPIPLHTSTMHMGCPAHRQPLHFPASRQCCQTSHGSAMVQERASFRPAQLTIALVPKFLGQHYSRQFRLASIASTSPPAKASTGIALRI